MKISLFLLLILTGINASFAKVNSSSEERILNNKIQALLDNSRVKYQLPALSLSIKLPQDKNIKNYTSGYYSLEKKKKITTNTLFQIGSITKTFTATIVLKLVTEKKLALNDALTKYLPQYPRWHGIKIKNLLNHTSGVYNYTHDADFDQQLRKTPTKHWSLSELANRAYHHADLSLPNQEYRYTNTDYILLGLIIEKTTHQSLDEVFAQYLHEYHLHHTFYAGANYPSKAIQRIARGYNRDTTFSFNKDVTLVSLSFVNPQALCLPPLMI